MTYLVKLQRGKYGDTYKMHSMMPGTSYMVTVVVALIVVQANGKGGYELQ